MPLSDITVVDLTRILAGPFCTQLLADMGADVIKIEPPAGDPVRKQGIIRDGMSWYFAQFNRNKKSVVLDLYTDEGKHTLARLIEGADVLVENYRPGVLHKMGFDQERLESLNPDLVVTSINGYGSTGPYTDRPSFDFIAQAMSGFMSVNGTDEDDPMRAAPPMSDLIAGLYAAFGTLAALHARKRIGKGQRVESSLTGGLISMLGYLSAEYFATGDVPKRTGNDHPIVAPYGLFTACDGAVAVAPSNDAFVVRFLECIGLVHLLEESEYATNERRVRNRPSLNARINARMSERTVDHWIEAINRAGCPCGQGMDLEEVFSDPQVLAQGLVLDVSQPDGTAIRMTGFPVKLSDTPARLRHPVPTLGSDTDQVLASLKDPLLKNR